MPGREVCSQCKVDMCDCCYFVNEIKMLVCAYLGGKWKGGPYSMYCYNLKVYREEHEIRESAILWVF